MPLDTGLILAAASFIGAIAGTTLSNFVTARLAHLERKEARRKEQTDYLINALQSLIQTRKHLVTFDKIPSTESSEQDQVEAIGIMLSVNDSKMLQIAHEATKELSINNATQGFGQLIDKAIQRLGELVSESMLER